MNKKLLNELINASFDGTDMIDGMVTAVAKKLKRSELKQYINGLKKKLMDLTVSIESPFALTNQQESEIKNLFPGKNIVYSKKSSLLMGIRIINKDMIYDFSLKNRLERLTNYITHD